MDIELRQTTEEEFRTWSRHIERAFGHQPDSDDKEFEAWRAISELDRTIAACEGGDIVGTAGAFSFDMAVPGGASLPVAGVTAVSVRSTHRRRGVLRRMMEHQLDDVARRGEPIAVLTASEAIIYGRFGYGQATSDWGWEVKGDGIELAAPSRAGGRIRLLDKDEAVKVLPGIRERVWRRHPGEFAWSQVRWDSWMLDLPRDHDGASPLWFAVHESASGEADGYAAWRTKPAWDGSLPNGAVIISHLYGSDDEVEAALFEHLLSIDLVRTVSAWNRPVDDPLRWRLADPRRMRVRHVGDHLWLRLLDIERSLSARELGADDRVVVAVTDGFRPQASGTYVVEPGACRRDDTADADLAMDVRDLGALYLGGTTATTLARAGRVEERTPGALARADRLLASSATPWCATHF